MKENSRNRIKIIFIIFFLYGLLLIGRLFYIQVLSNEYYNDLANEQYIGKLEQSFKRGEIYFKKKNGQLISAATLKKGFVLAINPSSLINPEEVYKKISKIIEIDKEDFLRRANKKDDPYEEIIHKLNDDKASKIEGLNINGVSVYPETWRFYPAKNLASKIIGFVGYKGDELAGRYGLERFYEDILKRKNKSNVNINFFAEIFSNIKKEIFTDDDIKEGDIILTIDPEVQSFLENTLQKILNECEAELSGGLIINPKTGEILAMSAKPDFDPNLYGQYDLSLFTNPITGSIFEMGSTMKPLTIAAALDQNKITPQTTYVDKGYVIINNSIIENYDKKARGKVNMQEVLNKSLNTGAVFIALDRLGKEKFRDYIINYGLGVKTGIDFPDELAGHISNLDSGQDIEYATASFGHGIAITPIGMAVALSSLANGGFIMKPYLVDEIKIKNGKDIKIEPQILRQVLKKETSEEISRMLSNVVDTALMGGKVKIEHYSIAAKTGTAQLLDEDGNYSKDRLLHSFFGYAPAFDARFLTFLFLINPQCSTYASYSLTYPFMNITKFLLNYYEIPPDR